jgi:hypothetical protein
MAGDVVNYAFGGVLTANPSQLKKKVGDNTNLVFYAIGGVFTANPFPLKKGW